MEARSLLNLCHVDYAPIRLMRVIADPLARRRHVMMRCRCQRSENADDSEYNKAQREFAGAVAGEAIKDTTALLCSG